MDPMELISISLQQGVNRNEQEAAAAAASAAAASASPQPPPLPLRENIRTDSLPAVSQKTAITFTRSFVSMFSISSWRTLQQRRLARQRMDQQLAIAAVAR